jgi:hypothetical protein
MGPKRELKFALESFWDGKSSAEDLQAVAADLRSSIWKQMAEAGIKYIPSNTFSYYDQVLDTTTNPLTRIFTLLNLTDQWRHTSSVIPVWDPRES